MSQRKIEMPDDFDGIVRLFPMPNLVLFPGVIQALNIFEPRYRLMMEEAVEKDGLITMAMIKPEQLATSPQRPSIFETVCIGKIMTHAKLQDGCYNLLLAGIRRARILEEVNFELPYRKARVEVMEDFVDDEEIVDDLRLKIVEQFIEILPNNSHLDRESLDSLLDSNVGTGQLVDLIAYSSGATPLQLQKILEMNDVQARAQLILKVMQEIARASELTRPEPRPTFPPDFSAN